MKCRYFFKKLAQLDQSCMENELLHVVMAENETRMSKNYTKNENEILTHINDGNIRVPVTT